MNKKTKRGMIFLAALFFTVIIGVKVVYASPDFIPIPKINLSVDKADSPVEYVDNIKLLLLLTVLTLLPSFLIMTTSFVRIIVVFSLFKNAIGAQQAIPKQVLIGLALFLTFFIMAPTFNEVNENALKPYLENEITQQEAVEKGSKPIRDFMLKQTNAKDLKLFLEIGDLEDTVKPKMDENGEKVIKNGKTQLSFDEVPLYAVVPSFMISELKTAFTIGFCLFIPFLLIDIVTGSVLMSMGMMMVPPVMIALPFKLLLFVMVDGWHLLIKALIISFK
jgi:flagellar biosynthetic protein FliP